MSDEQQDVCLATILRKVDKIGLGMERFDERQEKVAEDVAKIKEAVYNPDEGIYSRLKELEGWKDTVSKIIWAIAFAVVTLFTASFYKLFVTF
jgi:hypothetical protein|tara:strand:+ start:94 stop:372 length:279 start_codon:yes stop_codon:yes gene_type:complete